MSKRKSRDREREVEKPFTIYDFAALVNSIDIISILKNIKDNAIGAAVTTDESLDKDDNEKNKLMDAIKLIMDSDKKKLIEAFLEIYTVDKNEHIPIKRRDE